MTASSRRLTRVVIDDVSVEVAQLQRVRQHIRCMLTDVPSVQREYVADALLNLALARLLKEKGRKPSLPAGEVG